MTADRSPSPLDSLIPPDRRGDARALLEAALPGKEILAAKTLTGGASGAAMLRLETAGGVYVLRLDGPPDGLRDPARQYVCQAIAADRGLAPALIGADPGSRMSLSAFVADEGASMERRQRLKAAARSVRTLHDGPAFPRLLPYMDAMGMVIGHFMTADLAPPTVKARVADLFAQLKAAYPQAESDVVASHCDLNPGNILYAAGQAVFVDWESAFAADRYVDVAALLNYMAADADEAALVLGVYLGRPANAYEAARADAMRQVNRLFYGTLLLSAAAAQGARATAEDLASHTYARFRLSPVNVAAGPGKIALGCAFINDALTEMNGPRFGEGLARLRS